MRDRRLDDQIRLPEPPATIHFVGIGGIGMSGLARMLARRGYRVTGSDLSEAPIVDSLRAEGIQVAVGHDAANLGAPDLVVATAAVPGSNPELVAARERQIPVVKRAAVLGLLCHGQECVAVAGSHGKSTTSGMLAFALERAGEQPSFAVGAVIDQLGTNAAAGGGRIFVAEADEYDYSFLWLKPRVAVITNIEFDHPDLFPDLEAVEAAFAEFVDGIQAGGTLVISADDARCRSLVSQRRSWPVRIVTFGFSHWADWRIERVAGRDHFHGPEVGTLRLRLAVPGAHNRLNAAAALAAAAAAGVNPHRLIPGLEEFTGVGRRFEIKGQVGGVSVVEDYAHHPTELRATVTAARERYPSARITAVFQPHTYSRTRSLLDDFAAALSLADRVVLAPIYAARETDDLGIRSEDIAERIVGPPVDVVGTLGEAASSAAASATAGDLLLILGAGDIWKASEMALRRLVELMEQP